MSSTSGISVTRLSYSDEVLSRVTLPGAELVVTRGIGSGLTRRADNSTASIWAIGDRGPNFKLPYGIAHFGLDKMAHLVAIDGVKVMPMPEIGPAISELRQEGGHIILVRTFPLKDGNNSAMSGLPFADSMGETAVNLDGATIPPEPSGVDSEGIAVMADGTFWVADEYGPSLLHVAGDGTVRVRWVPIGTGYLLEGAGYPVVEALPAIATTRQFNRGFEAIALSADDAWLYVAFQSPLAHPDENAHRHASHTRILKLSTKMGAVAAQFLYPMDEPASFLRDAVRGKVHRSDLKISEFAMLGPDRLLVLERASATTKFYTVTLSIEAQVSGAHLSLETSPTLEQMSAAGQVGSLVPELFKTLLFSTDDFPEIDADLEGVALLGPRSLLLVNDNDFGVEGVSTQFWRVDFTSDL